MLAATLYFLGIAGFIVAALICLTKGKRSDRHIEVDIGVLRTAAVCFLGGCRMAECDNSSTGRDPSLAYAMPKWREMKSLWLQWYANCQEQAQRKQQVFLSWGRTLVVCALLCLVGVYLEVQFGESVSWDHIFDGILR